MNQKGKSMIATPEEQKLIDQVHIGSIVQHYSGKKMKVLAVARHTEDNSLNVVYQKMYNCDKFGDRAIVMRPLKMFVENVLHNGEEVPRFKVIEKPSCACC